MTTALQAAGQWYLAEIQNRLLTDDLSISERLALARQADEAHRLADDLLLAYMLSWVDSIRRSLHVTRDSAFACGSWVVWARAGQAELSLVWRLRQLRRNEPQLYDRAEALLACEYDPGRQPNTRSK